MFIGQFELMQMYGLLLRLNNSFNYDRPTHCHWADYSEYKESNGTIKSSKTIGGII